MADQGLNYLIIGTPRSGTKFMSELLTKAGYPTNHEAFFGNAGYGTWYRNAYGESSCLGGWFAESARQKGTKVIHIIRNPMKVISSLNSKQFFKSFFDCVNSAHFRIMLPELEKYDELDRYLHLWIEWNKKCAENADITFRIEDINEDQDQLFKFLGITAMKYVKLGKKVNSYKGVKQLSLTDLKNCKLYKKLIKTAGKFGYNL